MYILFKPHSKKIKGLDVSFQITNWTFGFWLDAMSERSFRADGKVSPSFIRRVRGGIALGPLTIDWWR